MTYSIIAKEGAYLAVGCVTASVCVGGFVPHAISDYGCLATQGFYTNRLYADWSFELFYKNQPAHKIVEKLLEKDENHGYRQCIIMDKSGQTAGHTGKYNEDFCGHICQQNLAVAGNRLKDTSVLKTMIESYQQNHNLSLSERLILSLEAGFKAGGDKKGAISAAIKVVHFEQSPIDLRIDQSNGSALFDALKALNKAYFKEDFQDFLQSIPTDSQPTKAGNK
ncbi:DUF1028 domain-containing protein [Facilibium subflavum]|uniref:DUF1028 domain-containing protein n=1 Tax=Facilibium subflavum TaxID=2219058 RepID=UPI0013C35573|nr:DUF1028 domain-containing protein [Facilibium subflavum]